MSLLRYSLKSELVSPVEKMLKEKFFSNLNTTTVVGMVHSRVSSQFSRGEIVDVMHTVFTHMLGSNQLNSVEELNAAVVQDMFRRKNSSDKASFVSRKVGFERNKIPSNILPRASFSLESEDENMGYILFK